MNVPWDNIDDEAFLSLFEALNLGHATGNEYYLNGNNVASSSNSSALNNGHPSGNAYYQNGNNGASSSSSSALNHSHPAGNSYYFNRNYESSQNQYNYPFQFGRTPPLPPPCSPANHRPYNVSIHKPRLPDSFSIDMRLIELISNPLLLSLKACDQFESRQLRKTIRKRSSSTLMPYLTQALADDFLHISCNMTGRQVIRECFNILSLVQNKPLCEQMNEHYFNLATNQYGCILLNDCLPYLGSFFMDSIFRKIVQDSPVLAQHHYGTYVVQNAISKQHPAYTRSIVERLRRVILRLATQKEGSHLVEKCLFYSPTKIIVLEELCSLSYSDLRDLACHEYGNFVLQKALLPILGGDPIEVQRLTSILRDALHQLKGVLKSNQFGRRVNKKCEERLLRCRY